MRRIAAHYIYWKDLLPLHYIEVDEDGFFIGISPLTEEKDFTLFWDGIVYPVPESFLDELSIDSLNALIQSGISRQVEIGCRIKLCRIL
ncbi:MAG: hypothetical protein PHG27_05375 [Massilibacteroides sp.]|nr:hypothetical protein [Massilibacteroides sp.]MDD3061393.1 hypothetical protein [Massilibacteroides sp.]MDD4115015.1 hypothetical protein [Massilibacteroides sp.]MDD4659484.1 hypothetical protein [Massilibacteroides sp.]